MAYDLNLITDRTQGDVNRYLYLKNKSFSDMTAEERLEWASDMKGAYNCTDLNRVEGAINYLIERMRGYGYGAADVETYRLWNMETLPTAKDMAKYLKNIRDIRSAFTVMATTPPAPDSMQRFTYKEANDIEQILLDIDTLLTNMERSWFYSTELYSGEV